MNGEVLNQRVQGAGFCPGDDEAVWRCPNRARHDFVRSFDRGKVALITGHGRLATHAQEHVVLGLGPQQERLRSLQEQCRVAIVLDLHP